MIPPAARRKPALLSRSDRVAYGPVPTRITLSVVMRAEFIPIFAGDAVQVVDHFAVAYGQLAEEFLIAVHARSVDIHKTEIPVQHRSEEHTSELQSHHELVCRLLLEK